MNPPSCRRNRNALKALFLFGMRLANRSGAVAGFLTSRNPGVFDISKLIAMLTAVLREIETTVILEYSRKVMRTSAYAVQLAHSVLVRFSEISKEARV